MGEETKWKPWGIYGSFRVLDLNNQARKIPDGELTPFLGKNTEGRETI